MLSKSPGRHLQLAGRQGHRSEVSSANITGREAQPRVAGALKSNSTIEGLFIWTIAAETCCGANKRHDREGHRSAGGSHN